MEPDAALEMTYPSIDFVLLNLALGFHHEKSMIKQEHHKLSAVALSATALLQSILIDELTALLFQSEVLVWRGKLNAATQGTGSSHHLFTRPEDELLVELQEVEPILRLTSLGIDSLQEFADDPDDLRQRGLVWVVFRRMLQHSLKKQGISR